MDHEELCVRRGPRSGLNTIVAVHSTVRGPSLGGCRMWTYEDNRLAIRDALRLSEGMTYKSAVAGLPLGGGKGVIVLKPGEPLPFNVRDEHGQLLLAAGQLIATEAQQQALLERGIYADVEEIKAVDPQIIDGVAVGRDLVAIDLAGGGDDVGNSVKGGWHGSSLN